MVLAPYLIPETMARQPSAIYLAKYPHATSAMNVALAFEGHKQVVKVLGQPPNLFFTHCQPCVAFQDKSCPGGSKFLNNFDAYTDHTTITHPIRGRMRIPYPAKQCIKAFTGETVNTQETELTVETFIPDYVMMTS